MSTGGKFIIEANLSGQYQDKLLLDYKLLVERINELKRSKDCVNLPILQEIEKTHMVFVKKYYKPSLAIGMEFQRLVAETGEVALGTRNRWQIINYGDYNCEWILNIRLRNFAVTAAPDKCGYYDFLGHRIINYVGFEYGGNIIDEYSGDAYIMFYNFIVGADKRRQWRINMGQEVGYPAYLQQDTNDDYRIQQMIVNGAQTPKDAHTEVDLWIPILFDWCRKPESCLFADRIPWDGQKNLYVDTRPLNDIIFVNDNGGGGGFTAPTVNGALYINHIFIPDILRKLLDKQVFRSLIRVFKENTFAAVSGREKLSRLRFPIETLYFGLRPTANVGATKWHLFSSTNDQTAIVPARIPTGIPIPPSQLVFRDVTYFDLRNELTNISFEFKDVIVVNQATGNFYSRLQPLAKTASPEDPGLMCVGFNFADEHTDKYDYAGYFNISSVGDFYINYSAGVAGEVYMMARCFNWIEIDERGNLTVKYRA